MNSPSPIASDRSFTATTSLPKTETRSRTMSAISGAPSVRRECGCPADRGSRHAAPERRRPSGQGADRGRAAAPITGRSVSTLDRAEAPPRAPASMRWKNSSSSVRKMPPPSTTSTSSFCMRRRDRRGDHRHDLVGLAVDHAPRDIVARRRGAEHEQRELDQTVFSQAPVVHRLEHLAGPAGPSAMEPARRAPCRASTILRTDRVPERSPAHVGSPPQSPEIGPTAGNLVTLPSGATASSSCRSRRPRRRPNAVRCRPGVRRTCRCARGSPREEPGPHHRAIFRSSAGRSAPARQYTPRSATG